MVIRLDPLIGFLPTASIPKKKKKKKKKILKTIKFTHIQTHNVLALISSWNLGLKKIEFVVEDVAIQLLK
jgi:hypothetical protein